LREKGNRKHGRRSFRSPGSGFSPGKSFEARLQIQDGDEHVVRGPSCFITGCRVLAFERGDRKRRSSGRFFQETRSLDFESVPPSAYAPNEKKDHQKTIEPPRFEFCRGLTKPERGAAKIRG